MGDNDSAVLALDAKTIKVGDTVMVLEWVPREVPVGGSRDHPKEVKTVQETGFVGNVFAVQAIAGPLLRVSSARYPNQHYTFDTRRVVFATPPPAYVSAALKAD